jgi:hypothetical protein
MKLTGEFTSLEEPFDDSDVVSILDLLANRPSFAESERRIEPTTRELARRGTILIR